MTTWEPKLLESLDRRREVEIDTRTASGEWRRTIIWIVVVDGAAYVRSYRGPRGLWYREIRERPDARLVVAGREIPVRAVAAADDATVAVVSAALSVKYRTRASTPAMLAADTLPTTLRVDPTG